MSEASKTIRLRRYSWDPDELVEVELVPDKYTPDRRWEVRQGDAVLGTVGRYEGSLDRKIMGTRLRQPGKRRTLWSSKNPERDARTNHSYTSRAEAIRDLFNHQRWLAEQAERKSKS